MTHEFSDLTLNITKSIDKKTKKENGIFITPRSVIKKLVERVKPFIKANANVLEPSCGTCEFVTYLDSVLSNIHIDAVELNGKIFDALDEIECYNDVTFYNKNFMKFEPTKKYDLVIGNPPYAVIKTQNKKNVISKQYREFVIGRPNLFPLFIVHSLTMLKQNGIMAFVIPNSFLNSSYYGAVRNHIANNFTIIDIIDFSNNNTFLETQQKVIGLVIKNCHSQDDNKSFAVKINDNYIFSLKAMTLRKLLSKSTTLKKLGCQVKTGNVVWNQHKDLLSDNVKFPMLIYNTNISSKHKIVKKDFKNGEKKQYINMKGNNDIVVVVNRGNGNSSYKFSYALVDPKQFKKGYLVENHLNVIYRSKSKKTDDRKLFDKIIKSFENKDTQLFIELFSGNGGLSKTELESIFPIFL